MKEGWREERLGSLCTVKSGSSNTKDAVSNGAFQFFDRSKTPKRSDRYLFDCEALIIAGEGAEFLPKKYLGKFDLHQRAYAIFGFGDIIIGDYLYYYLTYTHKYFQNVAVGATVKSLRQRHFDELPVLLPESIEEQKRIVAILSDAFEGIDAAIANTQNNLASIGELFDSYLNDVFAKKRKGWINTTIGEQIVLQRGFDITKKQQRPGKIPVISSGGAKSFHDEAKVKGPGVVVGRKGSIGRVYFVNQDYWPHDTTLWVKEFNGNNERLVYLLLQSLDLASLDSGAANPALNRNIVHPLRINWPSIDQQEHLVSQIEELSQSTKELKAICTSKLDSLNELKQSLLAKAFSGELTKDSEQQVLKEAVG